MSVLLPVLLENLLALFILIGVGYAARRRNWVSDAFPSSLSALLMRAALPATIFTALIRPFDPGLLRDGLIVGGAAAGFYLISAALALAAARLLRVPMPRMGAWMLCVTFTNGGFMGFPIIYSLFGNDGLALATFTNIPWTILFYTLGVWQLLYGNGGSAGRQAVSWKSILLTPINLALVLGLGCFLFGFTPPEAVMLPLRHLSNIMTPLSMMLIGMTLAGKRTSVVFRDRDALSGMLVRLIPLPLLVLLILKAIPFANPLIVPVLVLVFAMPSTVVGNTVAAQYGADDELAARIVFLSSLFCILTIPAILFLL